MEFGDRADDVIGSRPWTSKLPCQDQLVVTGGDLSKMSSNSVMLRVCELKAHGCGGTNRRIDPSANHSLKSISSIFDYNPLSIPPSFGRIFDQSLSFTNAQVQSSGEFLLGGED
ncbi:hypothetical protein DY000_02053321 [Brassica cretica]|uniref:Uncharacterized protein n=1 Tax=Brassica cretica TaxID=69181 RepID=A0ABQ7AD59_BRACR|nr:hypothetical protein DY000_02053321 [Brassica cretica]